MEVKQGKIIALVGAPRSGKSYLTDLLAKHYSAISMHEGEVSDFPKRILEDIEKNIRPLERIIWFRNQAIKRYADALKLKEEGKMIVMDTFWITYQLYIDTLLEGFEKELMLECAALDRKTLPWPDKIIFLRIDEKGIRNFIKKGARTFDQSEDFIKNQALPVNEMHNNFFSKKENLENLFIVNRGDLDFSKLEDLSMLIKRIDDPK